MKALILVSCICFFVVGAIAQNNTRIEGRVILKTNDVGLSHPEKLIQFKTVTLTTVNNDSTVIETRTDISGQFVFENVEPGDYWVEVECAICLNGLPRLREKVSVVSGQISKIDIEYDGYVIRESVTVSAGKNQVIEHVSKTIDFIDSQQMRDRADFSLVESLRTIPGFRVQQSGGFGRLATIKTRGLRNQDTAILLDGIRFRDPTAITGDASPFLSDLTLTSVDRIEVLRGSGSSLYGTNAVGGVLDFRTPDSRIGTNGQIGGAFGGLGLGRFRGNIADGKLINNRFLGFSAGVSRTGYTDGIDGDDNANNTNFQTRIDANPFSKTNISGRIFLSDADVRLNSDPDTAGTLPASNTTIINAVPNVSFVPDVNDPDKIQHSKFFSGQFVINQIINDDVVVGGYYQGLTTKRTNDNGPLGIGFQSASTSVYDGTIHTGNAHLNWTPNGKNQFTAGYEFESERFGNDGRTPSGTGDFFTRAGQKSNTFYVQDLVSLLEGNLQLAGGARFQKYSLDRPEFSLLNAPYSDLTLTDPPTAYTFDGAASYFMQRSGTKLRAHVGNGYRVPSLYERFGSFYNSFAFPDPKFEAIGDPFLKPEKTIAFDAGIEQNAANDRVWLSATYFYTRLKDIIGFGFPVPDIGNTPRPFGGYENQKGGIARGGEFSVKVRAASSTDIFASYTYTNSDQRAPQVQFSGILTTLGIPEHQFTLVGTQRFKRAWINFDFLATSSYLAPIFSNTSFSTYIYRFNGNKKGDLTAGYTFGFKKEQMTLRIYGTVENIFDQEYYENGFRTAGATGRAGLSFGF